MHGDERELRRVRQLVVGKPPTNCCAACPPYFKHTAHTCGKALAIESKDDSHVPSGCCLACPPHLRHCAHTCGKTYIGKRYGKRRKTKQQAVDSLSLAVAAAKDALDRASS